jgi:hypothetical protein
MSGSWRSREAAPRKAGSWLVASVYLWEALVALLVNMPDPSQNPDSDTPAWFWKVVFFLCLTAPYSLLVSPLGLLRAWRSPRSSARSLTLFLASLQLAYCLTVLGAVLVGLARSFNLA